MNNSGLICKNGHRVTKVRNKGLNGLDYIEVSDDQRTLSVYFIGKAPANIGKNNIRISGGRRIRDIEIMDVSVCRHSDPYKDDHMLVKLNKPGDFSAYTLSLAGMRSIDPRYASLPFCFKANCPTDMDFIPRPVPPVPAGKEPETDYLAKDYESFRRLILDRLSLINPDWREEHVPDVGMALVELLAYTGDHLSYYQDAVATEAYLNTARQRISVRRHARLLDYKMHEGCNARAWVHLNTDTDTGPTASENIFFITGLNDSYLTESILTPEDLKKFSGNAYLVFEPLPENPGKDLEFFESNNEIHLYTWENQECCLEKGATCATLVNKNNALKLKAGDFLLFEEVIGPETGNEADANSTHRHVVRLTECREETDPVNGEKLLEIRWPEEDALPFTLHLSVLKNDTDCKMLENISVARGNILLADQGCTTDRPENLGIAEGSIVKEACESEGWIPEIRLESEKFRPILKQPGITFQQKLPAAAPASALLKQDPSLALPCVYVRSIPPVLDQNGPVPLFSPDVFSDRTELKALESYIAKNTNSFLAGMVPSGCPDLKNFLATLLHPWEAKANLIDSQAHDRHYAVEIDNEGYAHLRFGDGELGHMPEPGTAFLAVYRTGNGKAGNVGAKAISHIVFRDGKPGGINIKVRNPLPAQGGSDPEPVEQVRQFAPYACRSKLKRAVRAQDYADIVMEEFKDKIQKAAAQICWNGSWHEVQIAVDPFGKSEAAPKLLNDIETFLYPFRRAGHDIKVIPARYVPLDLMLTVCVIPGYIRGHVRAALLEEFGNNYLPDGRPGFFHPDELSFGDDIYLSKILARAQSAAGVESVLSAPEYTRLERLHEGPHGEVEAGILPIGPLEIARLDNDSDFPENGILTFDIRGGR